MRLTDNIFNVMVIFLSVYAFTRGGIGVIVANKTWLLCLFMIAVVSIIFIIKRRSQRILITDILIFCMITEILLWNNQDFVQGNLFLSFVLIIFYTFLIAAEKTSCWFDTAIIMIIIMGLFHAFWTIVCFFKSDVFFSVVYPIVKRYEQWDLSVMYKNGFMMGFNYSNTQDAIYLTTALIACFCSIFFSSTSSKFRLLKILLTVAIAFSLLLTGKRGSIVAFSVTFIFIYLLYNIDKHINRVFKVIMIAVVIVAAIYVSSFFVPETLNFIYRFVEMAKQGDITTNRINLWELGLKGFFTSPIIGHGWFWFKYNNSLGTTFHVHNCFIQWLCELGIIGSIPWFCFVYAVFINTIKMIKNIKIGKLHEYDEKALGHLTFSAMYQLYFLIYAFAGTTFYEPECLMPYIFSCGMTIYYGSFYKKKHLRVNNI